MRHWGGEVTSVLIPAHCISPTPISCPENVQYQHEIQPASPVPEDLELRLVLGKGTTSSWPGHLLMGTGGCVCRLRWASEQPAFHMMQEDKSQRTQTGFGASLPEGGVCK